MSGTSKSDADSARVTVHDPNVGCWHQTDMPGQADYICS
jgi:hypothetical protein